MFTTGIVLKICMQHTDEFTSAEQQQPKHVFFGVKAGVLGVETSTPPTPLDRTLQSLKTCSVAQ